jgi:transcriptional regulator with XRE-family HTH domain
MPKTIRDVDASVGARLLLRRKELGLSQSAVGEKVGLTFQQIQKYENGVNRISAGVLYALSRVLEVPIKYFFEDCEPHSKGKASRKALRPDQLNAENDG